MSVRMDGPELKRYSPERETPRAAQGRPLHPWPPPGALRLKECACALSGTAWPFSLAVLVQGPGPQHSRQERCVLPKRARGAQPLRPADAT